MQKSEQNARQEVIAKIGAVKKEYAKRASSIEATYQTKTNAIYGVALGALLYGFFTTVLTACKSERFSKDFVKFLSTIWSGISWIFQLAVNGASYTWTINKLIPYDYVDVIIAGILTAVVFVLIAGILYGSIGFSLYKFVRFYKEEFFDLPSLIVLLVSTILLVWFVDNLSGIPLNLVLIWIIIQGIYLLIRMLTT